MPRFLPTAAAEAAGPRRVAEALRWLARGEGRGLRSAGAQGGNVTLGSELEGKVADKAGRETAVRIPVPYPCQLRW